MFEDLPLQLFQIDMKTVMKAYQESLAKKGKTLSNQSCRDLVNLYYLLDLPWKSLESCWGKVYAHFKTMPMGIFQRERTGLKCLIEEIIDIHAPENYLEVEEVKAQSVKAQISLIRKLRLCR